MHPDARFLLIAFPHPKAPIFAQELKARPTGSRLPTVQTQDSTTSSPKKGVTLILPSPGSLCRERLTTTPEPTTHRQKRPRRFYWRSPRQMEKRFGAIPK